MNSGIRIDKEGVWYYNDAEMIRKDIIAFFAEHLMRDEAGNYLIQLNEERCAVEVEDVPFVVRTVTLNEDSFSVMLSDESTEELNVSSLHISEENILYCQVKQSRFTARFSRAAYYQFTQFIKQDVENNRYFVSLNGQSYYIQ